MTRVTALTQFVFVALGTMALTILLKTAHTHTGFAQDLRLFLVNKGLWMFLVPVGYAVVAEVALHASSGKAMERILQGLGVVIAAALLATYGWLILTF